MKGKKHEFKYRYICEKCDKMTDWFTATIEEETETYADVELLSSIVNKNRFNKQLQKFKEKVENGEYGYHFQGGAACPFCSKRQSWLPAVITFMSPAARIVLYMCGWLFIGLIFVIGVPILQSEMDLLEWLPYESWIFFLCVPLIVGLLLAVRRNKINARKDSKHQTEATTRNKPEIDWNGI